MVQPVYEGNEVVMDEAMLERMQAEREVALMEQESHRVARAEQELAMMRLEMFLADTNYRRTHFA